MSDPTKTFKMDGKVFTLSRSSVVKAVRNLQPGPIRKYSVLIEGVRYPIIQVIARVTGLPPLVITPAGAYKVLRDLDFQLDAA